MKTDYKTATEALADKRKKCWQTDKNGHCVSVTDKMEIFQSSRLKQDCKKKTKIVEGLNSSAMTSALIELLVVAII